jgi:hypothetical protein
MVALFQYHLLPVSTVSREVQLARNADSQISAVVAVGFVVTLKSRGQIHVGQREGCRERHTNSNHVGDISRDGLDLIIELVQNLIILSTIILGVERCHIASLLLLEPSISIGDVANYGSLALSI